MIQQILIAWDGSPPPATPSTRLDLARRYEAGSSPPPWHIPPPTPRPKPTAPSRRRRAQLPRRDLDARDRADRVGVPLEHVVIEGDHPAEDILALRARARHRPRRRRPPPQPPSRAVPPARARRAHDRARRNAGSRRLRRTRRLDGRAWRGRNRSVESLQGQLLIASPGLLDPNFHRTVVLVTEHNDEGAAGLVLNRPSPAPVADVVRPTSRSSPRTASRSGSVDRCRRTPCSCSASSSIRTTRPCRCSARSASRRRPPASVLLATTRRRVLPCTPARRGPARGRARTRRLDPRARACRRCVHRVARRAVVGRAAPQGRRLRARRPHARGSVRQLTRSATTTSVPIETSTGPGPASWRT